MLVYVVDKNGTPLMPCSPGKARSLLKSGSAKVISRTPFVIQLCYGSAGYKQPITLSVDSGSTKIGFATIGNKQTLYASEVLTRKDIHKKLQARASYRRTRRGRLRYRPARWQNRKRKEGWSTPTMHSKVDSHLREIFFVQSILPISNIIIETATFDIHKIVNPDVTGKEYQNGRQKDFLNIKQYVLSRDGYLCQCCLGKKKDPKLHVHHIIFREQGGTNSPDNLITLCKTCHRDLHAQEDAKQKSLKLKRRGCKTKDATQVSTIGSYLKKHLVFEETFGYETKWKREKLGLRKEHYIDAICAGIDENSSISLPDIIYQKVCIAKGDYSQTTGQRSEKLIPTGKIMGFKKFDKVEWLGHELFIKGRMSTGYAILMDINGKTVPFKPLPKLNKLKKISARKSCLIVQVPIENFPSNITSFSSVNTEKNSSQYQELVPL